MSDMCLDLINLRVDVGMLLLCVTLSTYPRVVMVVVVMVMVRSIDCVDQLGLLFLGPN